MFWDRCVTNVRKCYEHIQRHISLLILTITDINKMVCVRACVRAYVRTCTSGGLYTNLLFQAIITKYSILPVLDHSTCCQLMKYLETYTNTQRTLMTRNVKANQFHTLINRTHKWYILYLKRRLHFLWLNDKQTNFSSTHSIITKSKAMFQVPWADLTC